MEDLGLYGPFKNPDEIHTLWYRFTEKELEESIEQIKKNVKDSSSKYDKKIYENDLAEDTNELKNLCAFVDSYNRCKERYKRDRKKLREIEEDWREYNFSLYLGWNRIQQMKLNSEYMEGDNLKDIQAESRAETMKRKEIEDRFENLLN